MNKPELTRAVSEKADISQTKAELVVHAFTEAVTQTLAAGDAGSRVPGGESAERDGEIKKPARGRIEEY